MDAAVGMVSKVGSVSRASAERYSYTSNRQNASKAERKVQREGGGGVRWLGLVQSGKQQDEGACPSLHSHLHTALAPSSVASSPSLTAAASCPEVAPDIAGQAD